MFQRINSLAKQCFHVFYVECLERRAQCLLPEKNVFLSVMKPFLLNTGLDDQAQQNLRNLLEMGVEIYCSFGQQGKVFVGSDDGDAVLCLACAATLQGNQAIDDLFGYCQRYAVDDCKPVARSLTCEICGEALIPTGYPGANSPITTSES